MSPAPLHTWIWQESHFQSESTIPLTDRGFRYGMAVFESLRLSNGTLLFAREHWALLEASTYRCGLPLPSTSFDALFAVLKPFHGEWFVRLYVTAGDGAPSSPVSGSRLFLLAEPRCRESQKQQRLIFHPNPYLAPFIGLKTANYWNNVNAFTLAQQTGATEALLFNPEGQLVSASMANIFLKIQGQWITPPLLSGARNGVIRQWVLDRLTVKEAILSREHTLTAEAGFLTNSWIGIEPIAGIENHTVEPGPEALALQTELENRHS